MAAFITPMIDRATIPAWGKDTLGKFVKLDDNDPELESAFEAWQAEACIHPETAIFMQVDSAGRKMYFSWCESCGNKISTQMKHGSIFGGKSQRYEGQWDEMAKNYLVWRKDRLEKITREAVERASGTSERYADYLRSAEWRELRAKVIERAGGICEGCLSSDAHEVHHMTYKHIYAEFAFELKALCSPCHERWHHGS